ncbi:MAG TPA: GNAT family N-acetyltransferase [Actinomycetota bacterium]|nr:GNAT family N-acetyltransferase [Actinomycetota bacterium]
MARPSGRPERPPARASGERAAPAIRIREGTPADARACAEVHVEGWRWAYRGLLPDAFLDRLSVEDRERMWREGFAEPGERVAWVAERDGRVVGFCVTGPSEDADADRGTAEVYAIYLRPEVVGTGVGRRLFEHAVEDLRRRGFRRATLWVLEANERARRFYERAGWRPDGAVNEERIDCANLPTVRYRVEL